MLVEHDQRLDDEERRLARLGRSEVTVTVEAPVDNLLRQRKQLLRWLGALMGEDGVIGVDRASMALWSRSALDDELAHDADVDLLAMFSVHLVSDEAGRPFWAHTHGLKELGFEDVDVIGASPRIGVAWDVVRAIVSAVLEERLRAGGAPVALVGGVSEARLVRASDFRRAAGHAYPAWVESLDDAHVEGHAVVCEPEGWLRRWLGGRPRPWALLQQEDFDEDRPILFSAAATELMEARARATWPLAVEISEELAGLELPCLVKLGYEGASGTEHLWFEVQRATAETIEAVLVNQPFQDLGMNRGDRRVHDAARLTEWRVLTPFGTIDPSNLRPFREVRGRRAEVEAMLAAARAER